MINVISAADIICIYHLKLNVSLVTKPLGVFSSETEWLNVSINVYKDFPLRIFLFNVYTLFRQRFYSCILKFLNDLG